MRVESAWEGVAGGSSGSWWGWGRAGGQAGGWARRSAVWAADDGRMEAWMDIHGGSDGGGGGGDDGDDNATATAPADGHTPTCRREALGRSRQQRCHADERPREVLLRAARTRARPPPSATGQFTSAWKTRPAREPLSAFGQQHASRHETHAGQGRIQVTTNRHLHNHHHLTTVLLFCHSSRTVRDDVLEPRGRACSPRRPPHRRGRADSC